MSRFKLLLVWIVCLVMGLVSTVWMLVAIIAGSPRAWNIAKGFDCLGNETFGDDRDKYVSSRCWRYRAEPFYSRWVKVIDWLFGDPNHCKDSFENEQVKA